MFALQIPSSWKDTFHTNNSHLQLRHYLDRTNSVGRAHVYRTGCRWFDSRRSRTSELLSESKYNWEMKVPCAETAKPSRMMTTQSGAPLVGNVKIRVSSTSFVLNTLTLKVLFLKRVLVFWDRFLFPWPRKISDVWCFSEIKGNLVYQCHPWNGLYTSLRSKHLPPLVWVAEVWSLVSGFWQNQGAQNINKYQKVRNNR